MEQRTSNARYLVLCGSAEAPRALLFDHRLQYLAEVFDDGLIVDDLLRSGTRCALPRALRLDVALAPEEQGHAGDVRCFALH